MRTVNSAKNLLSGTVSEILYAILGFVVRTIFIRTLSQAYLGINGLLGSIFTVLNLANLGLGSAIIYAMYKPMAEKDLPRCRALVRFYRNAYRIIGGVILVAGLALTPFLPILAKGSTDLVDLRVVYYLSLTETVSSYWFYSFLSSVPISDQKDYLNIRVGYIMRIVESLLKMASLWLLRSTPMLSFYFFCGIGVVCGISGNMIRRVRILRRYPWTRDLEGPELPEAERKAIYKNVAGMAANKISAALNDGIDSTIISAYLGVATTGVFGNYLTLRNYVVMVLRMFFNAISASVGNLCAVETKEKQESFFNSLQFTCFWIYGFGAICFYLLLDHFIAGVWIRKAGWLLSRLDVLLISANFLIEGMAKAVITFRDARGLYWQTRYRYIFSSVFNAALSIILTGPLHMGVTGALLGTTVSLIIMVSYDPVLVYKSIFEKSARVYYKTYFSQMGLVLLTGAVTALACLPFAAHTVTSFLARFGLCLVIPNGLWFLLFRRDERLRYLVSTLRFLLRRTGKGSQNKKEGTA